jgi:hypothetical protein
VVDPVGAGSGCRRRRRVGSQFEAHADFVVSSQVLQLGLGQRIEPVEPLAARQFSHFEQGAVHGIAALHRAQVDDFHESGKQFGRDGWQALVHWLDVWKVGQNVSPLSHRRLAPAKVVVNPTRPLAEVGMGLENLESQNCCM